MDRTPEPISWNEVKTFLENQGKEISSIAEGVVDLGKKADRLDGRVAQLESDMEFIKPIIQTLAPVPNQIREMKDNVARIEKRLDSVEAKAGA